jgi:N-acetylmuramoyl-L-alanine amidase
MSAALKYDPNDDLSIGALTVYGEARGEGPRGWEAVAWVIRNRAERPCWWGRTVKEVCQKPWQFSCWNKNDPNSKKLAALKPDHPLLVEIKAVVQAVFDGTIPDPTGGATHYHTEEVSPVWARGKQPTRIIGAHHFYAL